MAKSMKSGFVKKYGIEEVKRLVKLHSEQDVFLNKFACDYQTTPNTIRRFIELYMPGFEYIKQSVYPKDYKWLINGSIDDTAEFITELYINQDKPFNHLVKVLNADSNQLINFLRKYVPPKSKAFEAKEDTELLNTIEENRYFSIHIVGSNPEALDRLRCAE